MLLSADTAVAMVVVVAVVAGGICDEKEGGGALGKGGWYSPGPGTGNMTGCTPEAYSGGDEWMEPR